MTPLRALPFSEIKTGAEVVFKFPYTSEEGVLVDEYWYGKVGLLTKSEWHWIKFMDLEDDSFVSEEKHPFDLAQYYDSWMLVERA